KSWSISGCSFLKKRFSTMANFRRVKKEPCIDIGDAFPDYLLNTLTVASPISCVVIGIRNRDYPNCDISPQSLCKYQSGSWCMSALRHLDKTISEDVRFPDTML